MNKFVQLFVFIMFIILIIFSWFWFTSNPALNVSSVPFQNLPGWQKADPRKTIAALQYSCKALLKMPKEKKIGTALIPLRAEHLWPACQSLPKEKLTAKQAREYFEQYFSPLQINKGKKSLQGKFTGYYMPLLKAQKSRSKDYSVPLYSTPKDLVSANLNSFDAKCHTKRIIGRLEHDRLVPYYTRSAIESGAIKEKSEVLAWVQNPFERLILEIEGSGVLEFNNGKKEYIGHAIPNGRHYSSLPQLLIQKGYLEKDDASYEKIRKFFKANPKLMRSLLNHNQSFVFFRKLPTNNVVGAEGVVLTPGVSMAVDLHYIPLGIPIWLDTEYFDLKVNSQAQLQRLMVAQDTGGAILGPVRGDFFWGEGISAEQSASHMQSQGSYWILVPKTISRDLA